MQKSALALTAALAALCVVSCKDENKTDLDPKPVVYDNYTQLKTGNYWIYQLYDVDSNGNGPAKNSFDSTFVLNDSLINNNTYYHVVSNYPTTEQWLRDSLHYMVDVFGRIKFSSEDFTTDFVSEPFFFQPDQPTDTTAWLTQRMADKNALFTTPAGTFETSDFQIIYDMYPNNQFGGVHRVIHQRYAKNIGLVSQTIPFFMNNPAYEEKRLIRYHLN